MWNLFFYKIYIFFSFKVSSRQKETSSTTGMRESVETSLLLQHRAKVQFLIFSDCLENFGSCYNNLGI